MNDFNSFISKGSFLSAIFVRKKLHFLWKKFDATCAYIGSWKSENWINEDPEISFEKHCFSKTQPWIQIFLKKCLSVYKIAFFWTDFHTEFTPHALYFWEAVLTSSPFFAWCFLEEMRFVGFSEAFYKADGGARLHLFKLLLTCFACDSLIRTWLLWFVRGISVLHVTSRIYTWLLGFTRDFSDSHVTSRIRT